MADQDLLYSLCLILLLSDNNRYALKLSDLMICSILEKAPEKLIYGGYEAYIKLA